MRRHGLKDLSSPPLATMLGLFSKHIPCILTMTLRRMYISGVGTTDRSLSLCSTQNVSANHASRENPVSVCERERTYQLLILRHHHIAKLVLPLALGVHHREHAV